MKHSDDYDLYNAIDNEYDSCKFIDVDDVDTGDGDFADLKREYGDSLNILSEDEFNELVKHGNGAGTWTSLILGIIGSVAWIIPFVGIPITIVGTVLGAINMGRKKSRGVAIAGFVTSLVFMLCGIAKMVIDIIFWFKNSKKK